MSIGTCWNCWGLYEGMAQVVHAFPSLQVPPIAWFAQPDFLSQPSLVQSFPSSHETLVAPSHMPTAHRPPIMQASRLGHGPVRFVCLQPLVLSQLSCVHTLLSSQFAVSPMH